MYGLLVETAYLETIRLITCKIAPIYSAHYVGIVKGILVMIHHRYVRSLMSEVFKKVLVSLLNVIDADSSLSSFPYYSYHY